MNRAYLFAAALAACSMLATPGQAQVSPTAALADFDRPPPDRARDANRKPADLIAFAGVKAGDKVLDFMPGGGYYTRLLSKVVGPQGHVYGFIPLRGPNPWSQAARDAAEKAGRPPPQNPITPILSIQDTTAYPNVTAILVTVHSYGGTVPVHEQVDVVWMTDSYHDLKNETPVALDVPAINRAIFRAMKAGGTYLITDHSTARGAGFSQTSTLHRADVEAVKAEILAAGFEFVGESSLLANRADDRTKPIFDASLRGKTDQFVLKFRKPLNAPDGDKRRKNSDLANYYGNTFLLGPMLRIWWHPDNTYQEYSANSGELTSGTWYADADGHICLWHENIPRSRGFVSCHPFEPFAIEKKPGDAWVENGADGAPWQVSLQRGMVWP